MDGTGAPCLALRTDMTRRTSSSGDRTLGSASLPPLPLPSPRPAALLPPVPPGAAPAPSSPSEKKLTSSSHS